MTIAPNPDKKPESVELNSSASLSQYTLEFNRSPAIGNRFRLEGTYSEARLGFTRPQGWKVKSAKAVIRFQHSPDLLKDRSNLIVRVNDRSLDRVPLNLKQSQVGGSDRQHSQQFDSRLQRDQRRCPAAKLTQLLQS